MIETKGNDFELFDCSVMIESVLTTSEPFFLKNISMSVAVPPLVFSTCKE